MEQIRTDLLLALNALLKDGLSPHTVSYNFDVCAETMRKHEIKIIAERTKYYFFDEELNSLYQLKNSKSVRTEFKEWLALGQQFKELKETKPKNELTLERVEPSVFEFEFPYVKAFLNPSIKNEKLIMDLITSYDLEVKTT